MIQKTIIQELNERAIEDSYLYELLEKIQNNYGTRLFKKQEANLSEEEYLNILRYADILSRSDESLNRNVALKIISTLFEEYKNDLTFQLFSKNVLVKLGNFPSLNFLEKSGNEIVNDEIELDRIAKEIFQKTSIEGQFFTDSQYDTFNKIKNSNHFSFSAGTSFGKSFLFTEYVKWLINEKNASENIAFLVPTRALITQVVADLTKSIANDDYKIVSNADIPKLFRNKKFIFVFTPERLISYFSKPKNPNISAIIIDEAHNTVANDERSPMFYHAITLAEQKSINLFFAAPNVPNPEIFLELVGNSIEESKQVLDINVVQNRFFLDFTNNTIRLYFDYIKESKTKQIEYTFTTFENFLVNITGENQSLIYCNSIRQTVESASEVSLILNETKSSELLELSKYIQKTIHDNYFLAEFIKKGIGFHFGALPQEIRDKIENQFKKGNIKYLFTTSTLLQGVNLPAKNLFVLSEKIGLSNMSALDFKNLAGRAGRLTKELFGNIFVVKLNENKWNEKSQKLLGNQVLAKIESKILTGKKKFYENIGNVITDKEMTNKSMPEWEKRQIADYATILAYQKKKNVTSQLVEKFSEENKNAKKIIKKINEYKVPNDILMMSTTIKPKYQERILEFKNPYIFELKFDYDTCLEILFVLYDTYNWGVEEDKRYLGNINKMRYYAVLMTEWIKSEPLSLIIKRSIKYMEENKLELSINNNPQHREVFYSGNINHINQVVNDLLKDIENVLRFKVKNYVLNYLKLTGQDEGEWQNYLEYGTNENLIIELQKIGFERQVSIELSSDNTCFELNNLGEIMEVHIDKMNFNDYSVEAKKQIRMFLSQ